MYRSDCELWGKVQCADITYLLRNRARQHLRYPEAHRKQQQLVHEQQTQQMVLHDPLCTYQQQQGAELTSPSKGF
ncbi:hypothetical protein WJX74_010129 [Apatococcus lobatus]|uniref:Uncharacterized protein n=1 Tax=Apatococcus lobatus TaxID=904363 RepID=A0AAW1RR56_9CHLO